VIDEYVEDLNKISIEEKNLVYPKERKGFLVTAECTVRHIGNKHQDTHVEEHAKVCMMGQRFSVSII
jgi:hypothetical protein